MKPFVDFGSILDLGCGGPIDEMLPDVAHYDVCHHNPKSFKKYQDYNNIQFKKWKPGSQIPYDTVYDTIYIIGALKDQSYNIIEKTLNDASKKVKTGGKLILAIKLLNNKSIEYQRDKKLYTSKQDKIWSTSKITHKNVAISETLIRRNLINNKLMIQDPILYGQWCGYKDSPFEDDIIIAVRQ